MTLRVLALAPPELPEGGLGRHTLKSIDPASMFNACRLAAQRADSGVGAWGESNWAASRTARRDAVLLMHSLKEDLTLFEEHLLRVRPNMLLIGAMSVCLPGAVACAARARSLLGDEAVIVLGGRHPNETIYRSGGRIHHHPASPARLMAEGLIPPVFDLVISGEGEHLIAELGEQLPALTRGPGRRPSAAELIEAAGQAAGDWIASWCDGDAVHAVSSPGRPVDRDLLPTPAEMFGVRASFDVFGGRLTGHVFSDTGNGCVFDCQFCSERKSVTGGVLQLSGAAQRLARQLRAVVDVVGVDSPGYGASAFVEDSTLLGGSPREINRLVDILRQERLDIRFGGQFTTDQIFGRLEHIKSLTEVGLDYLFIGIETLDPTYVGGMSKDRLHAHGAWMRRIEQTVEKLDQIGVRTGGAVLFGLGERHEHRLELLTQLAALRRRYGSPTPISLNWATQHPLRGDDGGTQYRYHEWSVPAGDWADAFRDFGEATVVYPLAGVAAPILSEVREIADAYRSLFGDGH